MAVSLKHNFQSVKDDGVDATLVQASAWNEEHVLQLGTSKLLGRTTAGTGVAEEIAVSSDLLLSSGTLGINTSVVTLTGSQTLTNKTLTSPTLTTPALGTPASGVLTNATGLPISTGVSGLGTNIATFLATPSSANLISAVTDETGSGSLVFATSPTFVTPILGTPTSGTLTNATGLPLTTGVTGTLPVANGGTGVTGSTGTGSVVLSTSPTLVTPLLGTPTSGVLTNATGLPISTGVSGLGTGVATFLATPSSANLASAITDETGSGALVFGTSPSLTTPTIITSATVPTVIGGTAVSSALTLQSTSGVGSSDSIVLNVGNNGATTALSVATTGIVTLPTTGALKLPSGTTAQQPTGVTGMIRFNTTDTTFEGYNGTAWAGIGGGAVGGGVNASVSTYTDQVFLLNSTTVQSNYTIPTNDNAGTFGPITVNSGVTVTVPSGSTWSIV